MKREADGVIHSDMEEKYMFKCVQCGYEDETRKKVKYCPACGQEVEKKDGKTNQYYNPEYAKMVVKQNEDYIAQLEREKGDLAAEIKNLKVLVDEQQSQLREVQSLSETNANAAKGWKADYEKQKEECDAIWYDMDSYKYRVTQLEAENLKLARRGIPLKCKRCMKKDKKAGYEIGIEWPCQFFDQKTRKCTDVPDKQKSDKSPPALWRLQIKNWVMRQKEKLLNHQEDNQRKADNLSANIERISRRLKKSKGGAA